MATGVFQERQLLQQSVDSTNGTDKYLPARIDDSGSPKYYGFLSKGGVWYIMKESTGGGFTSYTYFTGKKSEQTVPDFETNWTDRASLAYVEGASLKLF